MMDGTTYNLLFVCTGNTCRSPMAAAIAQAMLHERGWTHVQVLSAGTGAAAGSAASEEAVDVAREHGVDLSAHASRPLTRDLVDWSDLALAMGPSHMRAIAELGGAAKMALITSFLDGDDAQPIADPFGGDHAGYRVTYGQLEAAVDALLDRLEPILAP